ncbi:MAG: PQQ-like beta-propeller repeat protein [Planctomycetota bacterium]|nr:PQQ-like beta-propeller repeat protein [Planctomycetota bacterium]
MRNCISSMLLASFLVPAAVDCHGDDGNWPQWRGPLGTGVSPNGEPPIEWSEEKNVRWKVELPGRGHGTPIVWNDHVFLSTAIPFGPKLPPKQSGRPGEHDNLAVSQRHQFVALALDRATGRTIWKKQLHEALPEEGAHSTASLASASPVADGEHVFAFFGSHGLFCLDHDGKLIWKKDLGRMHTKHGHGEGTSPVLHGETLVINWDHEGDSFIVALEKSTGKEVWRRERDEVTSWATPIVVQRGDTTQLIVSGTARVRAYDLGSGKTLWECGGLSSNIVASPVHADGIVIAGSSYEKRAMLAIRIDGAQGDITDSKQVVWSRTRGTPYVPSPLLYGDALYFHAHYQSVLTRIDAKTGEENPGPFRLPGISNVYASAVGAAGRVYVTDLEGTTLVFSNEANPRIMARNILDDRFNASAAIAGRQLFLRGEKLLYCLEK